LLFLVRRLRIDVLASLSVQWRKWLTIVLEFENCRNDLGDIVTNLENSAEVASLVDVFDAAWSVFLSNSFLGSKWLIRKRVWIRVLSIDGGHNRIVESFIFVVNSWYLSLPAVRIHHALLKCAI
jgi:hypothetical protein